MYGYHNQEACKHWERGHFALLSKDFIEARAHLEKAKNAFFADLNNFQDIDTPYIPNIINYFKLNLEMGFLLNQTGSHIGAISYYEETLEYAKKVSYRDAIFLALSLNGLGYSSFRLSRFPDALAYFSEACPLAGKSGQSFDTAYFLIQQAACLARMNKDNEALDNLDRASSLLKAILQSAQVPEFLKGKDLTFIIKDDEMLQNLWFTFTNNLSDLAYKEAVKL